MLKIFSILPLVLSSLISFSQVYKYIPFPDSGVIWSEVYNYPESEINNSEIPGYEYECFAVNGEDTIINNKKFKKLFVFHDSVFTKNRSTYIGGIREDASKRVFYIGQNIHELKPIQGTDPNNEIILYDFSANIGDTIANYNYDKEHLIVYDIDTINIGNSLRKRFYIKEPNNIYWIEGIGSLNGLLFTSGTIPLNGLNNTLICFTHNDTIVYHNDTYNTCFPLLSFEQAINKEHLEIKVSQNILQETLQFDFTDNIIYTLYLYNIDGTLHSRYNTVNLSSLKLATINFSEGVYIYHAICNKKQIFKGKFLIRK